MSRIFLMLALVIGGELVFGLAFNVPRFFKPTMLDVFGISNTQLGDMFAMYGIVALLAYFPGGAIADRFSARSLIAFSLVATSAGGLYMATIPGPFQMRLLYAYWGLTTIFLFWGALIKATRDWGGERSPATAFGILDGGRGLVAALVSFIGIYILASYLPSEVELATAADREAGFRVVIYYYSGLTFLAGVLAWFAIPDGEQKSVEWRALLRGMGAVSRRPIIWAQACLIICAYCGYKGLDNYGLYAEQVLGKDEITAALFSNYGGWTRPVAAVLAGVLADRFGAARSIAALFIFLCSTFTVWTLIEPSGVGLAIIYLNFFATFAAVYALRGVYFALLEEDRTPTHLTGAAIGLVSLVGFMPDVFFGPVTGRILDANPGIVGFQNYFLFLAVVFAIGIAMVMCLVWLRRKGGDKIWDESAEPQV